MDNTLHTSLQRLNQQITEYKETYLDFITGLGRTSELLKRLCEHPSQDSVTYQQQQNTLQEQVFDTQQWDDLCQNILSCVDDQGFIHDSKRWKMINQELKYTAQIQQLLTENINAEDAFHTYARNYDAVVGKPCLNQFMQAYIAFFIAQSEIRPRSVLSIGCGTGLTEEHIQQTYQPEVLLGLDVSPAMVAEARHRIEAKVADITQYQNEQQWDMVYTGLNVLQYLPPKKLPDAIRNISHAVRDKGYFVGDFISPDHIRCYPNLGQSEDQLIMSLRTPSLVEHEHKLYQRSELINISTNTGQLRVNYEGAHKRYLPPIIRVVNLFSREGFDVKAYDAVSLEALGEEADASPSTRYVLIAQKK